MKKITIQHLDVHNNGIKEHINNLYENWCDLCITFKDKLGRKKYKLYLTFIGFLDLLSDWTRMGFEEEQELYERICQKVEKDGIFIDIGENNCFDIYVKDDIITKEVIEKRLNEFMGSYRSIFLKRKFTGKIKLVYK
jgi:hypothetical protein